MGYVTAAFTTNGDAGPFSGTHQGSSSLSTDSRISRGTGADSVSSDAENVIGDLQQQWIQQNRERNFFLYIHTMDAHGVCDPPAVVLGVYPIRANRG